MKARLYDARLPRESAASIAYEVVCDGVSEGWSGSHESLAAVQAILEPRGIVYFDDMRGSWHAIGGAS